MQSTLPAIVDWFLALLAWYSAPAVALVVSTAYFVRSSGDPSMWRRIVTSSHGVTIALLYVIAMGVALARAYDPAYGNPFSLALLVPVVLMALSLVFYRGSRRTHWLQFLNAGSLAWTGFMGGMAITGRWL